MLIASRWSRSGQASHGPGGIDPVDAVRAGSAWSSRTSSSPPTGPWPGTITSRELGDRVEHVGPLAGSPWNASGVTPKKQRSPAKQHVDVGDERHEVAGGVARRRQHLDPRRELRARR